jgi:aconitate hydratase
MAARPASAIPERCSPVQQALGREDFRPVAVLSGNRNFPGRVHPDLEYGFLASPPLVVAFALAGTVNIDIMADPIGTKPDGSPIYLSDIWPSGAEIDEALARRRPARL